MPEDKGVAWLGGELRECVQPVLSQPWIMDIDVTVKPIYGHQQGAEVGYNPHKPGRPSHCYHSYFMANTRLCLGPGRGYRPCQQHLTTLLAHCGAMEIRQRWTLLLTHIFRHWLGGKWLGMLPPEAESLLSG
jgi:hypothetical protein